MQFELLLFAYMHRNIVLHSHIHLLCKTPFYKIVICNAFDDYSKELKSFHDHIYPGISVLELDILPTLQVLLWTVHFFVTLYRVFTATAEKWFTVYFYNSSELFPTLSEVRSIIPYLFIDKQVLGRLGSKVSTK